MFRLATGLALLLATSPLHAGEIFVAHYNVENLFTPTLNPVPGQDDPEFTPAGNKQWDDARLTRKIDNLAGVIKKMNNNNGPDVLGLCEIENRAVVEKLAQAMTTPGRNYQVIHQDCPSNRGIDCAILYDAARLQLQMSAFYVFTSIQTRDVVEAEFETSGKRFTVFMNHWPSQNNPATQRETVAKRLRQRLDQILAADVQADLLVMGDLNDMPNADSVKVHLRTSDDPTSLSPGTFFNTMAPISQMPNRGSYVFNNQWQTIDHVIVSPGLLNAAGFKWKANSTSEVKFTEQIFTPSASGQIPRPNRTFTTGNQYHADGISDHLPVCCVLEF